MKYERQEDSSTKAELDSTFVSKHFFRLPHIIPRYYLRSPR